MSDCKKKYKWSLLARSGDTMICVCSNCGVSCRLETKGSPNYCPNCGKKMVVEKENG